MDDRDHAATLGSTGSFAIMPGNALFEAAVGAVGFDESVTRRLLTSVANAIGSSPDELTPHDLGVLLPEIERRLRQLATGDRVDDGMRGVQRLLLTWEADG